MTYRTPVETQSEWLLGTANNLHAFREELWRLYSYRDPQNARLGAVLEGLTQAQERLLANTTDEFDTIAPDSAEPEDIAWRRCTVAYAYAGLLNAKAILRLQPAVVSATLIRLTPGPAYASPHRLAYFKSLSAGQEVLDEAVWKLRETAEHLTGPEPDRLKAFTGDAAFRMVRSAAVTAKPAEPDTAQKAAGPGAVVVASPPTRAASARTGARR
ncbi:hypothetical protein ABH931_005810 [Streptacidiphilus sp. MAP12-33]|uniref:hypothetical protein n=1 Tax=Streptacidiphilus sp. MAP12-33 TaxID=3156266 RepID=UPI0035158234